MARGRKNLTFDKFLEKARDIHGEKYEYFEDSYQDYYTKLPIRCTIHGMFYKTPHEHLTKKRGCEKCAIIKRSNELKERKSREFFIKAVKIHNGKYIYQDSNYQGVKIPIKITCPLHGDFYQIPNDHLNGHGCPKCSQSRLEREIKSFLIENNIEFQEQYKIISTEKLKLDFFLPKLNIGIECQGGQHFNPIEFFGGEDEFSKIIDRDKRKFNICEENGVKLLYFTDKLDKIPDIEIYTSENLLTNKQELLQKIYLYKK